MIITCALLTLVAALLALAVALIRLCALIGAASFVISGS